MLLMALRTLALVVLLGLPSVAGAVEGLFHLCHGRVQLDLTCCCDHSQSPPRPASRAHLSAEQDICCAELKAQRSVSPTVMVELKPSWAPLPLALMPHEAPSAPPGPEKLPSTWEAARGVHHATAPPLYIQHCSYLI